MSYNENDFLEKLKEVTDADEVQWFIDDRCDRVAYCGLRDITVDLFNRYTGGERSEPALRVYPGDIKSRVVVIYGIPNPLVTAIMASVERRRVRLEQDILNTAADRLDDIVGKRQRTLNQL